MFSTVINSLYSHKYMEAAAMKLHSLNSVGEEADSTLEWVVPI